MKYFLMLTASVILYACSTGGNTTSVALEDSSSDEKVYTALSLDEYKEMYNVQNYVTTNADKLRTEIIDFDCAILIYPTDEQIEEMRREMSEDDFYIIADDNNWYQGTAIGLIDSLNIRMITASERYVMLKGHRKSWTLDIRKENSPAWNLIFFKTTKAPEVVSTVGLTIEQLREYFNE
jgi:hypothetical protein